MWGLTIFCDFHMTIARIIILHNFMYILRYNFTEQTSLCTGKSSQCSQMNLHFSFMNWKNHLCRAWKKEKHIVKLNMQYWNKLFRHIITFIYHKKFTGAIYTVHVQDLTNKFSIQKIWLCSIFLQVSRLWWQLLSLITPLRISLNASFGLVIITYTVK